MLKYPGSKHFVCFAKSVDLQTLEAVPPMCSVIKLFRKLLQNSQESTYDTVSFSAKLQAAGLQHLVKYVSFWHLQNFSEGLFYSKPMKSYF